MQNTHDEDQDLGVGGPTPSVIDSVEEITPEWLTAAFRHGGRDLHVAEVRSERIGTGQMGATFRAHLVFDGASGPDSQGPASVVVKLGAGDAATRAKIAYGYRVEVGFLTEVAGGLDVRLPECYYGAIIDDSTQFTVVMADQVGAAPGVQVEGCSEAAAQAAIDNLVGLHAPRWNDATLLDHPFFGRPSERRAAAVGAMTVVAAEGFVERYRDQLTDVEQGALVAAATRVGAWMTTRCDPFTVIHGDYRLDNLLFTPDGGVVAVDWQGASVGPALRDVAYFLSTCVEPEQRRATEDALVKRYHAGLIAGGVTDYPFEQCWDDYLLGMFQGTLVTIGGCMLASGERSDSSDQMFLAMARRSTAAIIDHHVLDLIPAP